MALHFAVMLRILLVCAASAAAFFAQGGENLGAEWKAFKTKYGRNYLDGPEDAFRFKIFAENRRNIAAHNDKFHRGLLSYRLAMNDFGDMHSEEFLEMYNCGNENVTEEEAVTFLPPENIDLRKLPETVDWRKKGYVTPIKNQGACGACWAFSATGSLEGQYFRKTGKLVRLSEQNLVDCVEREVRGSRCRSGSPGSSFRYVRDNGGIDTEKSYPYVGRRQRCKFRKGHVGANVTGFVKIKKGSEELLKIAVATVGPISAFINPTFRAMRFYKYGIVDEPTCTATHLTHVVLVVGYGVKHGKKYWLIKNSYGRNWGHSGYAMIARDKNNMCGVASSASYPLV